MCFVFSSLLFCYPLLVGAFIIAGLLPVCARKKKKPIAKAQNKPASGGVMMLDQTSFLRNKNKMDEPQPEPEPVNISKLFKAKEESYMEGKKKELIHKPQEVKVEHNLEESKENQSPAAVSKNASSEDKSVSTTSCDICNSNTDFNANDKSKSDKKSKKSTKKLVCNNCKDKRANIKKSTLDEGLLIKPMKLHFTKEGGIAELSLDNRTTKRLGIKIHSTDIENFEYDPVYSFLEPEGTSILTIWHKIPSTKHEEMSVYYIEAPAKFKDAIKFFRGMPSFDDKFTTADIPMIID